MILRGKEKDTKSEREKYCEKKKKRKSEGDN
jgi:hypothetical protein